MSEFGKQIIFRELLKRHQRIQIPMIQRDYAQGRVEVKEVREEFLNALYSALQLPTADASLPLNLDFIYGSVEGDDKTRFLPLDGQQRLTTLFLLHWYLAWKDGRLEDFRKMLCLQGESRFSYSVRQSSTEFFNALVNFTPDVSAEDVSSLRELITDQSWYFRYWRLDPTIQSSITMLDSIHAHFSETEGLFSRLIDVDQPSITFQLLDLENFGLSDDLYIKMNARGKPLTVFETFKARYEQELDKEFAGEFRKIGAQDFSVAEYFARCMDTRWADFFWSHRDRQTSLYDDAIMNLFLVVVLITRNPKSDCYIKDIKTLRDRWLKPSFSLFSKHGWLDREFSETLFLLLESWSSEGNSFACQLPDTLYFNEVTLFEKVVKNPASLNSIEIVQFVAYVVFIQKHQGKVDAQVFQEWMRIILNLSVNTSYDRPEDVQRSIAGILKLAPHCGDILAHFANTKKPATGFNEQQISEERFKAELILANVNWRPLIDQAEHHGYFQGQIEFLLDFSGVKNKWEELGNVDWDTDTHISLQDKFENYLAKAEIMFNARGLANLAEYQWERALLSIGDYTLRSGLNYSFLVNSSREPRKKPCFSSHMANRCVFHRST